MIRILNLFAVAAMIASATWAYSVKYETILVAEKLKKRNAELRHERDAISVLEAEWQLLNRPARLAVLAKPGEGMVQMSARQVAQPKDIPAPLPKIDALDMLVTGSLFAAPKTPEPAPPPSAGPREGGRKAPNPPEVKAKAGHGAPLLLLPNGAAAARASGQGAASKTPEAGLRAKTPPANTGGAHAGAAGNFAPKLPAETNAPAKNPPPTPAPPQPGSAVLGALVRKVLN